MQIYLKRIVAGIAVLIFFIQTVYASETLKISAPPSFWIQEQGERLVGPLIHLLEDVFAEFGVTITSVPLPWVRAITFMKSGQLDMIPVIFYTDDRAEFMEFTEAYAEVPTSIFVPRGKIFPFSSIDHLVGKKGLIMRGDSISPAFAIHKSSLNLTEIAGYDQMLKMLSDQRADYAVAAQYGFLIEAKKLKCEQQIEMLAEPVASRSLHFAFSKKSPFVKYLPDINTRLRRMKADGSISIMVEETLNKAAERSK